ncbi:sarcolemmal membrane-associated protein [Musca domestica]|uniref:FHA domain protein n=1 Tax=Musca domestica TaxID=7370 RepID=T1PIQ8_MUSDO|nr:sarcolemmal membrane-associated protein [Musca domestica]XP_011295781.2 sarcolemmal membrane-associated protein [Musca domestica]XP_058986241.1 sarcolemmal membrane-associated protein [Musca domestica]XP_058986242.1 sarcolemmal membrane-associated protein [Musca domestica]XP_058986243.1 sarcolemmal membrane-associated protein [Musca domestica]
MVLVSSEWQNKSEDEQKLSTTVVAGTSNTAPITQAAAIPPGTTTTTAVAITSTILPATATLVNADTIVTATTTEETITPPIVATAAATENTTSKSPTTIAVSTTATTKTVTGTTTPVTITTTIIKTNDNNNEQQKDKNSSRTGIIAAENKIEDCNNINIITKPGVVDDDDNNDDDDNKGKQQQSSNSITTTSSANDCNSKEEDFIVSVLNYNSNNKIMAENTKETPVKEEPTIGEKSSSEALLSSSDSSPAAPPASMIINSQSGGGGGETNFKDFDESNSNTNTLQPSVTVKTQNIQNAKPTQALSCPFTQQDFSSALQSALNATATITNSSTTAAAGLQPNFLSQLSLTANVAGLQKTAKQLNSVFNTTTAAGMATTTTNVNANDNNSNQAKNDSNLIDASGSSSNSVISASSLASVVPSSDTNNGQAKIVLICEGNSHPFQTRTISLTPNVECMVGRLIAKSKVADDNAIFDCKVLSRKHAVIWYTPDGKFWVKDTKSSNGTFINDNKLGVEEAELHFGDIVKFGVDVVENSRKEVHGCIIACVKLYLPDGREAISIDSPAHRSPYSGEGRISYDDLHRLNLYIQETAQREKVLTSKLCSIQNILDATRKNSALCWQSMITEDQLLHRIHSLEKKLSLMEKNVPENVLRNEVQKLLDEKNSYQHTAKEALRKVYQERCDAMQLLAKMESAYTQSDNECALLRDQIMNSKQTLQDVNTRLLQLETEYNEYRDDVARQQQEAKEREEQRIAELTEKLRERELECEELKKKISELLIKRADLLDDEEKILEKQAIEKLDAAIADMDLGDEDDDDDDEDDGEEGDVVGVEGGKGSNEVVIKTNGKTVDKSDTDSSPETKHKQTNLSATSNVPSSLACIFGDNVNGLESEDKTREKSPSMSKHKKAKMLATLNTTKATSPPKRVKESTIMKWLQNSDLNKTEGSLDIFKAICNENEEEAEGEVEANAIDSSDEDNLIEDGFDIKLDLNKKCTDFTSKLRNVEQNLKQLEAEIENRTQSATNDNEKQRGGVGGQKKKQQRFKKEKDVYDFEDNSDEDEEEEDDDDSGAIAEEDAFVISSNGAGGKASTSASSYKVLSKHNKKYQLLKASVDMLREAYNEIKDTVPNERRGNANAHNNNNSLNKIEQNNCTTESSRTSCATEDAAEEDIDSDSISSEVESLSLNSPVNSSSHSTIKPEKKQTEQVLASEDRSVNNALLLEEQLREYKMQVGKLNEKLKQTEMEAHHTLEIMQVECDDVKHKMLSLNKIIEALKEDKKALEQVINENKNNAIKNVNNPEEETEQQKAAAAKNDRCVEIISQRYDDAEEGAAMLLVENDLADINVSALEREEELIAYKERLDDQLKANIDLRNEIAELKQKAVTIRNPIANREDLLKRFLPYGFVVLAIIVYFISTYF